MSDSLVLEMLGEPLRAAILDARVRKSDDTITACIDAGLVIVSSTTTEPTPGMSEAEAVDYLDAL